MTHAMRLIPPKAAPRAMTVENRQPAVPCVHAVTSLNRPNDAMPASPAHDEAGRDMKVSLVNPHVPEVLHAWRELTQSDLPFEPTTPILRRAHRSLTPQRGHDPFIKPTSYPIDHNTKDFRDDNTRCL
jgi:hypothetical protein